MITCFKQENFARLKLLIKLVMLKVYQKFQPEVVSWCAYLLLNIYLYAFGFLDVRVFSLGIMYIFVSQVHLSV